MVAAARTGRMHALYAHAGITDAFQPAATARWRSLAAAGACVQDAASQPPRPARAERCRAPSQPTEDQRDSRSPRGPHAQVPPAWERRPGPAWPLRAWRARWQPAVPCRQDERLPVIVTRERQPEQARLPREPVQLPRQARQAPEQEKQPSAEWEMEPPRPQAFQPSRPRLLACESEQVEQQALPPRLRLVRRLLDWSMRQAGLQRLLRAPGRSCPPSVQCQWQADRWRPRWTRSRQWASHRPA